MQGFPVHFNTPPEPLGLVHFLNAHSSFTVRNYECIQVRSPFHLHSIQMEVALDFSTNYV